MWIANTKTDLAGYRIYRTQTPGTGNYCLNTSLITDPSFTDTTAVAGNTYYYAVTALNSSGEESSKSSEVQAVIPLSPNNALVFPAHTAGVDPSLNNTFVGVAVLNTAPTDNLVEISSVDSSGTEQVVDSSVFPSSAQNAFLAASLPHNGPAAVAFKAKRAHEGLRGFFLIGDGQPNRLDGVGGKLAAATSLFFPITAESRAGKTVLFLTNPDSTRAADMALGLINEQGQVVQTASLTLPAGASQLAALASLLPIPWSTGEYYLRVNANSAVQGCELLADSSEFWSAAGQASVFTTSLWIPHFILGRNGEDTKLRLINT